MNVTHLGQLALRLALDDLAAVHSVSAAIRAAELPGVKDVVPSWRTVVVIVDTPQHLEPVSRRILALDRGGWRPLVPREHVIPVRYDGPDLTTVAGRADLSTADVVRRHTAATYTVAFLGFAPGFAYLSGLDPALATSRLDTPRSTVPAGSVGIADDVTGIYPAALPGGWNLLGTTTVTLFDPLAAPPALLRPGDQVRFVPE